MKSYSQKPGCLITLFCVLLLTINLFGTSQNQTPQPEVVPGVVVIKLKKSVNTSSLAKGAVTTGISSLDTKLRKCNVLGVEKMFRHKPIPANSGIPDISRIMKVQIPEDINPLLIIHELAADPNVEYAEPVYKIELCAVPNDPKYIQQHYLPQIKAPEAWDEQKGDSSVIIAFVDTGTDYEHEDLKDNVWINEAKANGVTGVDDDGNGYIDDIHGWDFGDNDADPINAPIQNADTDHGTHVAGIACAVTDNNVGIAGVSWNCSFMPIKAWSDDYAMMLNPFEGIVYAADNGADVISNSWGRFGGYSQFEKDVINYAHSKGAIIVCGTFDNNLELDFYPASYQHAISVAAVGIDDKANYATFGPWIDISAPGGGGDTGAHILSTVPGNQYKFYWGCSMATPVVSGVCGLVKSLHPEWSNEQVIKQVIATADNIDLLNPNYINKLGFGRVNALRALTETDPPELSK